MKNEKQMTGVGAVAFNLPSVVSVLFGQASVKTSQTVCRCLSATAATAAAATSFGSVVAVATAATAAFAAHLSQQGVDLFLGGLALFDHFACKGQGLACQGVVEVHLDLLVADGQDFAVEAFALFVDEGQNGSFEHVVVVEVTVDGKDVAADVHDFLRVDVAVCVVSVDGEIEGHAFFERHHLAFKGFQGEPHAADELERLFSGRFFDHFGTFVVLGV